MSEQNPTTNSSGMLDEILSAPTPGQVPVPPVAADPLSAVSPIAAPPATDILSAPVIDSPVPAPTPESVATPVPGTDNSLEALLSTVPPAPAAPVTQDVPVVPQTSVPPASDSALPVPPAAPVPPPKPPVKKTPMRPVDFLKIVGALLLVALIFFGSFLAYVVFNPEQAQFFIQFGINPADIARLLESLVNGIFGTITFVVSIVWVVYLFRAIVTKKEYKRKKTVATILAIFFAFILFSGLGFWAFLIEKIGAEDFANPNGGVIVYDNDRYLSDRFKDSSEMYDFNNLVGPVSLRFDLSSDARYAEKTMTIESFEIDFDGDGNPDKEGTDPRKADDLVFTYGEKRKYSPKGSYVGKNKITRDPEVREIVFPTVNVSAVISVTPTKKGIVYDAKDAEFLGNPKWYESKDLDTPASTEAVYTAKFEKEERFICLTLVNSKKKEESCDKIFVIKPQGEAPIQAKVKMEKLKSEDPFAYRLSLEDVKVRNGGEIMDYQWRLEGGSIFCKEEECEWNFTDYGKKKIVVKLTDAAKNSVEIEHSFVIDRPLIISKNSDGSPLLRVTTQEGKELLDSSSYDSATESYRVENLVVPTTLGFDARDVRVKNAGYELESVEWSFGKKDKKAGLNVEYEIIPEGRTEVVAKYVFFHSTTEARSEVSERIVFDVERKDLIANFSITQDSEYAPSTIRFDGSASRTKRGTITKFIYDFGDGRSPVEGDAVQTYRYDKDGEYNASLTIIRDDGTKDVTSKKIVLKAQPKTLSINTSVSVGTPGLGMDFDVFGSVGQIDSYSWDFGDGTSISTEPTPTHTYESSGKYDVKLQVRYADGTFRNAEKEVTVK